MPRGTGILLRFKTASQLINELISGRDSGSHLQVADKIDQEADGGEEGELLGELRQHRALPSLRVGRRFGGLHRGGFAIFGLWGLPYMTSTKFSDFLVYRHNMLRTQQ